jgi:hypothetical protein
VLDFEALVDDGNGVSATRRVRAQSEPASCVYRGWMLRPERYDVLFAALAERGLLLVNHPDAYRRCHYLPGWYPAFEDMTPRSVWLETGPHVSIDGVMDLLATFGSAPLILKDFVKSRKHEWAEACFIPSASDHAGVERVVRRFIELQGDDLAGGLVFREFVDLKQLGPHPQSGMPLTREFRLFFANHQLIASVPYWDGVDYGAQDMPIDRFELAATRVDSAFFTMDVAQKADGDWLVIELGDGQVAGLPENVAIPAFYAALIARLTGTLR